MKMKMRRLTSLMMVMVMLLGMFADVAAASEASAPLSAGNMYKSVGESVGTLAATDFQAENVGTLQNAEMVINLSVLPEKLKDENGKLITTWQVSKETLGLYSIKGASADVTFGDAVVGTYAVADGVVTITLTDEHVAAASAASNKLQGKLVIEGAVYELSNEVGDLGLHLIELEATANESNTSAFVTGTYAIPKEKLTDKYGRIIYKWAFSTEDLNFASWDQDMSMGDRLKSGAGEWALDHTNKTFTITFDTTGEFADYVYDATLNDGINGPFSVWGYWDIQNNEDSDRVVITFGEDTFVIYPHGKGDVEVTKKVKDGFEYKNNGEVEWEIVVSSTQGTNGPITLTDETTSTKNVTIIGATLEAYGETTKRDVTQDMADGTIELPELPYANGTKVSHKISLKTQTAAQGELDTVTNAVTVSANGHDPDDEPMTDTASASNTPVKPTVKKECKDELGPNNELYWTVTVNGNTKNLTNMVLYDEKLTSALPGTIKVSPNNSYTLDQANGTITFNATQNGGQNKQKYTITYQTTATVVWAKKTYNGKEYDCYTYDTNTAELKLNGVLVADASETEFFTVGGAGILKKTSNYDSSAREITYTITVNEGDRDIGMIQELTDSFETKMPNGFTFMSGADNVSMTVNGVAATLTNTGSVSEIMDGLLARIKADAQNNGGKNFNTYTLTYKVKVGDVSGKTNNFCQITFESGFITGVYGGEITYATIPTGSKNYIEVDETEGAFKWKIVLNPDYTSMDSWYVADANIFNDTYAESPLVGSQTVKVFEKGKSTAIRTETWNETTYAGFSTKLQTLVASGNYKYEITFMSDITTLNSSGTHVARNQITLGTSASNTKTDNVDGTYTFTMSPSKSAMNRDGAKESVNGEHKLDWKVTLSLPKFEIPTQMTITDTFGANQYMTTDDRAMLESKLDTLFGEGAYTIVYNSDGSGFVITLATTPAAKTNNSFEYSTHIKDEHYAGNMKNSVTQTIGDYSKTVEDLHVYLDDANVSIAKSVAGATENTINGKIFAKYYDANGTAKDGNIYWTIVVEVPKSMYGKAVKITDNLPGDSGAFTISNVKIVRQGSGSASTKYDAGTGQTKSTHYTTAYSNGVLTVTIGGGAHSKEAAITRYTITVTAQVSNKDKLFDSPDGVSNEAADETSCHIVNTAKVSVETTGGSYVDKDEATSENDLHWAATNVCHKGGVKNGNLLTYTITINEKGADLLEGGDYLSATDTISWQKDTLGLTLQNVKLYYADTDTNEEVTGWKYDEPYESTKTKNTIELTNIPDGRALRLEYQYEIIRNSEAAINQTFTNTFKVNGTGMSGTNTDTETVTFQKGGGASSNVGQVVFYKYEKGNKNVKLEGVQFTLSKHTEAGWVDVGQYTTVADGKLNTGDLKYEENVLYMLVETQTLPGYKLDSTPYYFSYGEPANMPAGVTAVTDVTNLRQVWLPNAVLNITDVTIRKVWAGKAEENVTLQLQRDGKDYGEDVTLTVADAVNGDSMTWSHTFTGLDRFDENGRAYVYTVLETTVPAGYTDSYDGLTVTNTPIPTEATVKKVWVDGNNQDGSRPATLDVYLLANGEKTNQKVTLSEDNGWKDTITNLPSYANGQKIVYTWQEAAVAGYTLTGNTSSGTVTTLTNTIKQELIEIPIEKIWKDEGDQDGQRPDETGVTIILLRNNVEVDRKTLTKTNVKSEDEKDTWAWTFTGLDKYDPDGKKYIYTVKEQEENYLPGYTTEYDQDGNPITITNCHDPELINISGKKTWFDSGVDTRPGSITINLKADDGEEVVRTTTANAGNDWSWTFEGLPKYRDHGIEIVYTIEEIGVEGYHSVVEGFDITNIELTTVKGEKTWVDGNNADKSRPESITISLLANGKPATDKDGKPVPAAIVKAENGWKWEFTNLPKYDNEGDLIVYTVEEAAVPGYHIDYADNGYDVTNTLLTEVAGVKTWIDNNNEDGKGKRPETITINLWKAEDVRAVDKNGDEVAAKTVGATEGWIFTDLPKYDTNGNLIPYFITEEAVAEYTTDVYDYNVTNTLVISIDGSKTWYSDTDEHDDITIHLFANGAPATYSNGTAVEAKVVGADDNWAWTFTNLPKYDANGKEIVYTITEDAVEGYHTEIDGHHVTNIQLIDLAGEKTWDDVDNQDGIRPKTITITLLANGVRAKYPNDAEVADVPVDVTEKTGTWSFTGLPKYDDKGNLIKYTVVEAAVDGYKIGYTEGTLDVTNTHAPEQINLSGKKTWIDGEDEDGKRPASITIRLWADGEPAKHQDGTPVEAIVVTAADNWEWTFVEVPKYRHYGVEIVYTMTEDVVDDYTTEQDGYDFTNTIEQEYVEVKGEKTWIDPEGTEHPEITINLLRDGKAIAYIKLANGEETYEFTNLPKYAVPCAELAGYQGELDGHIFQYTVTEDVVDGYTTEQNGFDFTNTIEQEYIDIRGKKTWVDPVHDEYPEITINLLRDGEEIDEVKLANGEVTYSFEKLEKYAPDGHIYEYTVSEDPLEDYNTVQNGYNFTNTYKQIWYPITVTKIWVDNGAVGIEHPTITVRLLQNGVEYDVVELAHGVNTHVFENLPLYDMNTGLQYNYTITEDPVEEYVTDINGYTIVNTSTRPEVVSISGTKTWMDDGREHDNAAEIKLVLTRRVGGGAAQIVNDAEIIWNGNTYFFHNLPKADEDGNLYIYEVTENEVEGYDTFYDGYNITNRLRYDVVPVQIAGTKFWEDDEDAAGVRPETVTVNLLRDGVVIDSVTFGVEENWSYTFADLPDNDGYGHYYTYTVTEELVAGYWLRVDGYDLYNTLKPEEEPEVGFFRMMREEELEELLEIFDYGVPLWGGLLGTGDEVPAYTFVFGGVGLLALAVYVVLNSKGKGKSKGK